ncbi:MAG: hypothetical protein GTN99_00370, partial [Candidatus Dadabacteria bacterium]|nr:hypothetical protein [Candidatus Dadabacteria bacterium]
MGQYYPEDKFSISVYPFSTISSLKLIFSIVIFGFFLSRYLTNKSRILTVIVTVVLISLLQAAIGFYQTFYVYGIYHHEGAHGTFVNHNHYSGLLELTVPLILGFAFSMNKTWYSDFKKIAGS